MLKHLAWIKCYPNEGIKLKYAILAVTGPDSHGFKGDHMRSDFYLRSMSWGRVFKFQNWPWFRLEAGITLPWPILKSERPPSSLKGW